MSFVIPTKLEEPLVRALDALVAQGFYQSRSEAIRDSVRRLVERNYVSRVRFLRMISEISAQLILTEYGDAVTDVILYGSVATGRVYEDSDVDVLVLVSNTIHENLGQVEIRIHGITYPVALASESVITSIVLDKKEFLESVRAGEHFAREILRDGIQVKGTTLNELRKQKLPKKS